MWPPRNSSTPSRGIPTWSPASPCPRMAASPFPAAPTAPCASGACRVDGVASFYSCSCSCSCSCSSFRARPFEEEQEQELRKEVREPPSFSRRFLRGEAINANYRQRLHSIALLVSGHEFVAVGEDGGRAAGVDEDNDVAGGDAAVADVVDQARHCLRRVRRI